MKAFKHFRCFVFMLQYLLIKFTYLWNGPNMVYGNDAKFLQITYIMYVIHKK